MPWLALIDVAPLQAQSCVDMPRGCKRGVRFPRFNPSIALPATHPGPPLHVLPLCACKFAQFLFQRQHSGNPK